MSGAGDDLMWGDAAARDPDTTGGTDTFVFAPGGGNDVIHDFEAGLGIGDVLDVSAFGFASAQEVLDRATGAGSGNNDTFIDLGQDTTVTLLGVAVATLVADDILVA